jgi:nitrogen-specific signal transduction histidine kinase
LQLLIILGFAMNSNKTIESVKANDLFKGLDFDSLNIPFDVKNFIEFKEGDLIYSSGQSSDFAYLLIDGEVKIKLNSIKRLIFKSPNEFFGETEVLQNESRNSSAVANKDCLIYKIEENLFNKFQNRSSSLSAATLPEGKQESNEKPVIQPVAEPINETVNVDLPINPEKVSLDNPVDDNQQFETTEELNKIELPAEPEKVNINDLVDIRPKYETTIDMDKIEIPHYEQEPDLDAFIQKKYLENDNKYLKSKLIDDPDDMTNWVITEGSLETVSESYSESSTLRKSEAPNTISSAANVKKDLSSESVSEFGFNKSSSTQISSETEHTVSSSISDLSQVSNFIIKDVKAPFLTIKHYSSILSRFDLPEEVKRVISLLSSQATSVIDLLQSSIDFSEKKTRTKLETVSFNEVMDNNLTLLSDYVESRNVKLFKKFGEDVKIKIDIRKFYVACYYISRFACDMMKQGGNLYFSSQVDDAKVMLTIKDENKIEVSENEQKFFDPAYTGSNGENLGLSLAITKFIIESMNGSINLRSSDSGTSYLVSFPVS